MDGRPGRSRRTTLQRYQQGQNELIKWNQWRWVSLGAFGRGGAPGAGNQIEGSDRRCPHRGGAGSSFRSVGAEPRACSISFFHSRFWGGTAEPIGERGEACLSIGLPAAPPFPRRCAGITNRLRGALRTRGPVRGLLVPPQQQLIHFVAQSGTRAQNLSRAGQSSSDGAEKIFEAALEAVEVTITPRFRVVAERRHDVLPGSGREGDRHRPRAREDVVRQGRRRVSGHRSWGHRDQAARERHQFTQPSGKSSIADRTEAPDRKPRLGL